MTNPFEETEIDSENQPFIKHDFAEKTWYRGEEAVDVNYFMIDISTLKTGWGIYTKEENYEYSLKELEKLIKISFDEKGFPLTRSPYDLLNYTKYFLLIKEVIKDAQKYVPDTLENILEKNLECLKQITTPVNSLPLFNGSVENDLTNFYDYLSHFKIKIKKPCFFRIVGNGSFRRTNSDTRKTSSNLIE